MRHLTPIERARYCYLMVLAQRKITAPTVARSYLEEKVEIIYQATEADHIRNLLDLPSQHLFDNIWDESLAPKSP